MAFVGEGHSVAFHFCPLEAPFAVWLCLHGAPNDGSTEHFRMCPLAFENFCFDHSLILRLNCLGLFIWVFEVLMYSGY